MSAKVEQVSRGWNRISTCHTLIVMVNGIVEASSFGGIEEDPKQRFHGPASALLPHAKLAVELSIKLLCMQSSSISPSSIARKCHRGQLSNGSHSHHYSSFQHQYDAHSPPSFYVKQLKGAPSAPSSSRPPNPLALTYPLAKSQKRYPNHLHSSAKSTQYLTAPAFSQSRRA